MKTTNTGNNLAPLLNFNQTTLTSSPQLINSNNPLNNNNNNNNISCINNTIITTNNSNIVNSNHNHVINDDAINSNTLLITPVPNKIQKLNHSNTNSTSNTTTAALNDIDERLDGIYLIFYKFHFYYLFYNLLIIKYFYFNFKRGFSI